MTWTAAEHSSGPQHQIDSTSGDGCVMVEFTLVSLRHIPWFFLEASWWEHLKSPGTNLKGDCWSLLKAHILVPASIIFPVSNWKSPFVCSFSDSSPSITLFARQSNMSCSLKSSTPCQAEMLWNPKEMVLVVRYAWNDPSGGYSSVIKPSPNYSWDTVLCSSKPRDHQRVFHRDEISKNWPSSG